MASLFDAIVVQNLTVLSRGHTLPPRVLLVGGPHAFIRGLREAWQTHIPRAVEGARRSRCPDGATAEDLIVTPRARRVLRRARRRRVRAPRARVGHRVPGAGAAGGRRRARPRGAAAARRRSALSGMDLAEFRAMYERPAWTPPALERGSRVRGFIGLDAGLHVHQGGAARRGRPRPRQGVPVVARQPDRGRDRDVPVAAPAGGIAGRERRGVGAGHDRLREGHPEGRVRRRRGAGRDRGARQLRAALLRGPARHRGRRRPGHQDHRDARRPREGLPAEHRVLGRQRLLPAGDRPELRVPGRAVRGDRRSPRARCRCSARAAWSSCSRRSPTCSGTGGSRRRSWPAWRRSCRATCSCTSRRRRTCRASGGGSCSRAARSATWRRSRRRSISSATTSRGSRASRTSCCTSTAARRARSAPASRPSGCGSTGTRRRSSGSTPPSGSPSTRSATTRRGATSARTSACARSSTCRSARRPRRAPRWPPTSTDITHRRFIVAGCEKGAAEDVSRMKDIKAAEDAVKKRTPNLVALASREVWKLRHPASVADPLPPKGCTSAARTRRARYEKRGGAAHRDPARVQHVRAGPVLHRLPRERRRGSEDTSCSRTSRARRCTGPARRGAPSTRASRRRSRWRTCTTCCSSSTSGRRSTASSSR